MTSLTLEEAVRGVHAYNSGYCTTARKRRRPNLVVDEGAYALFDDGLAPDIASLKKQAEHIGDEYGGVAGFQSALTLVPNIASALHEGRDELLRTALGAPDLLENLPTEQELELLFEPFVQPLGNKSRWHVWAWKFWHFVNPKAFPIPDSRVDRFFRTPSRNRGAPKYRGLLELYRPFILERRDWVPQLREADLGHALSDLKLWDKVFYALGEGCS